MLTDYDIRNILDDHPKVNLADRVANYPTCLQLKRLGFRADTKYCWAYNFDIDNNRQEGVQVIDRYQLQFLGAEQMFICLAPTAKELLKQLKGKKADIMAKAWIEEYYA